MWSRCEVFFSSSFLEKNVIVIRNSIFFYFEPSEEILSNIIHENASSSLPAMQICSPVPIHAGPSQLHSENNSLEELGEALF